MSLYNIAVLASGSGSNLQAIIDSIKSGYLKGNIKLIVSDQKDAYALKRAEDNGINRYLIKNNPEKLLEILNNNNIDLVVLAGYLPIIESEIVKDYENRIINIHPSLIPKYCGKGFYGINVHKAVLKAGGGISGATVHYVDSGIDTGAIIIQKEVAVNENDTPEVLQNRVLEVEHKILVEAIKQLCENGGN